VPTDLRWHALAAPNEDRKKRLQNIGKKSLKPLAGKYKSIIFTS